MRWLLAGSLLLVSFPWTSPDGWVRRGNDAYRAGAMDEALRAYAEAEGRHADPGLVAFNVAAAADAAGNFALGAEAYRRALEDAEGSRRARALFGLANCLVHVGAGQTGKAAARTLDEAIQAYEACLKAAAIDTPAGLTIRDDARHNLELARALLRIKDAESPGEPPPDADSSNPSGDHARQEPAKSGQPARSDGNSGQAIPGGEPGDSNAEPQGTDQTAPGKGNLPPLLDDVFGPPLNREEALAHLRRNLQRMRDDRLRQASTPATHRYARDW